MAVEHNKLVSAQHNKLVAVLVLILGTLVPFSAIAQTPQTFDGPAELPRIYINSSVASTPSPGTVWPSVSTFADLQANVKNAACGDTVQLQAGVTFTGTLILPVKACDDGHWITIRTNSPDVSLPAEGTRLTPCYAGVASLPARPSYPCPAPMNVMAKIEGFRQAVTSSGPANHYRFIGIEFTNTPGQYAYSLLNFATDANGAIPDHIIVDRCWVHGTATDNVQRGYLMNGAYEAVIDSTITDIHAVVQDTMAVNGWTGTGPFKITDNFLESGSSAVGFGGAQATMVPFDIEIRHNYLFKPQTWNMNDPSYLGLKFNIKTAWEMKSGSRVLFESNTLENTWGILQGGDGGLVWIGPKNQNNGCPICEDNDFVIRYNVFRHAGAGIYIFDALSDLGGAAQQAQRYSIHDNLFVDIDSTYAYGGTGRGIPFRIASGPALLPPKDVSIQNNTAVTVNSAGFLWLQTAAGNQITNFTFKNNVVSYGTYGMFGSGQYNSNVFPFLNNYDISNNIILGKTVTDTTPASQTLPDNTFTNQGANVKDLQ